MSRESKPDWSDVPLELKTELARVIGAPIIDANVAWGGFGPSATFVLRTNDGRTFFCKGTHPGHTEMGHNAFLAELYHYRNFRELQNFGPAYRGDAHFGKWHLMVLDYVERKIEVPPWTDPAFRGAIAMLVRFHAQAPERVRTRLPIAEEQTEFADLYSGNTGWRTLSSGGTRRKLLRLFTDEAATDWWLDRYLGQFISLERRVSQLRGPRSWVHHDVRSDNLLFTNVEEPLLIDFPYLAYGPKLMDVAAFLPSVAGEGGPPPQNGLRLYEQMSGARFDSDEVAAAVAAVAGFFAARAGLPDIPGLPRLRWVQKLQLFPSLSWMAEVVQIDPPPAPRPF